MREIADISVEGRDLLKSLEDDYKKGGCHPGDRHARKCELQMRNLQLQALCRVAKSLESIDMTLMNLRAMKENGY